MTSLDRSNVAFLANSWCEALNVKNPEEDGKLNCLCVSTSSPRFLRCN